ncbi:hypothetical protein R1sor_019807 [Riccia sorocarpa]|uniref:PGG domain-containing protein n=1 Tax=Riccia sorocarpa TaxID=122646 RepID=A0ABD3IH83_9MARC
MEKLPEMMGQMSQTMEKIFQVLEKIPESIEKMTQTTEKLLQTVEIHPQTMENMVQTTGKVPQTLEILTPTKEKLEWPDEWLDAMRVIPESIEKMTQTTEKLLQTVEMLPQTMENMVQTTGKVPQTLEILTPTKEKLEWQDEWLDAMRVIPESIEKMNQTTEKLLQTVEILPQTMENMVQTKGKAPQTLEILSPTKEKLEGQDEWLDAMRVILDLKYPKSNREEYGFRMMHMVSWNPRLLTHTYEGCNALHLAMRNDWYGLVQDILLGADVLRDLLTCKEGSTQMSGTPAIASRGLDVLAMAVVHCHQAINTLLMETIVGIPELLGWYGHGGLPSDDLFGKRPHTSTRTESIDEERKILCGLLDPNYFESLNDFVYSDHAPNMAYDGRRGILHPRSEKFWPDILDMLDSRRDRRHLTGWMLTAPFLPFSEYLILDYSREQEEAHLRVGDIEFHNALQDHLDSSISFAHYVASISDTRRTVWQYAILDNQYSGQGHRLLCSKSNLTDLYDMRDSSGRTAMHLMIASGPPPRLVAYSENHPFSECRFLPWLSGSGGWDPRYGSGNWGSLLLSIHAANSYGSYFEFTFYRALLPEYCTEQIILTTPHLTESHRTECLLFIGLLGDPEVLRLILEAGKFDPLCQDEDGNTLLHAAVRCEDPTSLPTMLFDFVKVPEKRPHRLSDPEQSMMTTPQQREDESHRESRRQGCINLLLQEGLDIWEINKSRRIPDPGPKACPGYSLWWYERLSRETVDQKTSFNAAGSVVSVTAALVATASYIGPLQPPLGYSWEDKDGISKVQTEIMAVRVFVDLNTLAFYLAIAAVVLSFTPALPAPHESTRKELKRIQRSVLWALMLLIVSLISILSAFASASIVKDGSQLPLYL